MAQVQQREKRLGKEFLKLKQKPLDGVSVEMVDDNATHWKVALKGPSSTPYENGTFTFDFKFPNEYPFHSPEVKCLHFVYHPNFDKDGKVCLDILRKDSWSPMIGVGEVIIALREILRTPNCDHPLSEEVAEEYMNARANFDKNAREHTAKHAK